MFNKHKIVETRHRNRKGVQASTFQIFERVGWFRWKKKLIYSYETASFRDTSGKMQHHPYLDFKLQNQSKHSMPEATQFYILKADYFVFKTRKDAKDCLNQVEETTYRDNIILKMHVQEYCKQAADIYFHGVVDGVYGYPFQSTRIEDVKSYIDSMPTSNTI